jgi:hypothetical protein
MVAYVLMCLVMMSQFPMVPLNNALTQTLLIVIILTVKDYCCMLIKLSLTVTVYVRISTT